MKIEEILKKYLETITENVEFKNEEKQKETDLIKEMETNIEKLKSALLSLKNKDEKIEIDIRELDDLLVSQGYPSSYDQLYEAIKVLEGKLIGFPIDLTDEQSNTLNKTITTVEELILILESKNTIKRENTSKITSDIIDSEEKSLNCEILMEKIDDPENDEILDKQDFELLYSIIESSKELSVGAKKQLFIEFKKYNEDRANGIEKEPAFTNVNFDEVVSLFEELGFSEKFIKMSKKYEEEISSSIDLNKTRELVEFLDSTKYKGISLRSRFTSEALLPLLVYGEKGYASKMWDQISAKGNAERIVFEAPSVWIKPMRKVRKAIEKDYSRKTKEKSKISPLRVQANAATYDEMQETVKLLKKEGIDVSLSDNKVVKLFKTPFSIIKRNLEIYKQYDFFNRDVDKKIATDMFTASRLLAKCDRAIEVGILNGDRFEGNVAKNSPTTFMNSRASFFPYLYRLKKNSSEDEYYGLICSETKKGSFAKVSLNKQLESLKDPEVLKKFIEDNFVDLNAKIEGADQFESVISEDESIEFFDSVFEDDSVKELESEHTDENNKYIYLFGDTIISRYKVLRNITKIKNAGLELTDDALMYSICRNSYLDGETFDLILKQLPRKKGGDSHGLS